MVATSEDQYALGRSQDETRRLIWSATTQRTQIQRFLGDAGIGAGMRVLDVGCGPGDISFIAAELVGATGGVVGVDANHGILETARERLTTAAVANVEFREMRIPHEVDNLDGQFDAVVGRRVLCYIPDPVAAIRAIAQRVRTGGVVAFAEVDWTIWASHSYPPSAYYEQLWRWIQGAFKASGTHMAMGTRLYAVFVEAGLPPPTMTAAAGIGDASAALPFALNLLRSLRDKIISEGLATADDIDAQLIEQRLAAEPLSNERVLTGGFEVFASTRKA